jgi:hypothetical protein
MSSVQPVITQNGAPSLVATGIVQNARTITPANGFDKQQKKLLPVPYFVDLFVTVF